jgi:hypothetical protein
MGGVGGMGGRGVEEGVAVDCGECAEGGEERGVGDGHWEEELAE